MTAYDVLFTRTVVGVKQIHAANKTQAEELFYSQDSFIEQVNSDTIKLDVVPSANTARTK